MVVDIWGWSKRLFVVYIQLLVNSKRMLHACDENTKLYTVFTYMCMCLYVRLYVCTCAYVRVYVLVCTYVRMCLCICMCVCACMYMHVSTYVMCTH